MQPQTFQIAVAADGRASAGKGVLAAYVPASAEGCAVVALACDPRHDPGRPINELAPGAMAWVRRALAATGGEAEVQDALWAVVDNYGRFNRALAQWAGEADPASVRFERFPAGLSIDAFYKAAGAAGEAAIELLSALIEAPHLSTETPTQREFLEAVEAHGNLPAPGAIFRKVDAAANEGDAKQVASAIQPDPVLSASLINSANAARFANADKTGSVPQAVIRLGTGFVRRVVFVAEMMARYTKGACPEFPYRAYWTNAIATGAAMRGLLEEFAIPARHADDAFTTGLVSGIGWLAVAETFPALMAKYIARCADADPISKARAQRETFPAEIRLVSARYLERFAFPPHIQQVVAGKSAEHRDWYDCLARAARVGQALAPFAGNAVPDTLPVPDACREEWERWRLLLN